MVCCSGTQDHCGGSVSPPGASSLSQAILPLCTPSFIYDPLPPPPPPPTPPSTAARTPPLCPSISALINLSSRCRPHLRCWTSGLVPLAPNYSMSRPMCPGLIRPFIIQATHTRCSPGRLALPLSLSLRSTHPSETSISIACLLLLWTRGRLRLCAFRLCPLGFCLCCLFLLTL